MNAAAAVATSATTTVALTGVLKRGCVWENHAGSTPSRPIANRVRATAVAQARQTMKAETCRRSHQGAEATTHERAGNCLEGEGVAAEAGAVGDAEADGQRVGGQQIEHDGEPGGGDDRDGNRAPGVGGLLAEVSGGFETDVRRDPQDDPVEDAIEPA